ncbi:hypothetical protein Tco_0785316 [Tanacetum coccineum]
MDPMISLGQKNTLAEYMILSSVDNRPPMLDKDLYDSWKSRMELYMQNRDHRRMILESVEHADCDMKATNIILQGLPTDIYSLVNHHITEFQGLWREYQLQYRLINDMNIYNMKMEQFQVNTKFLNSLTPEWSKFVTDVKLVKDLHTTNFDQLHAYLEQHEFYANEVCLLRERDDQIDCLNKEAGQILDEEQLKFLADPGVPNGQAVQQSFQQSNFQTEDLILIFWTVMISQMQSVLKANISNYVQTLSHELTNHSKTLS